MNWFFLMKRQVHYTDNRILETTNSNAYAKTENLFNWIFVNNYVIHLRQTKTSNKMKTLNHLITQSPVRFLITTMFFSSLTYSFAQLPTAQEKENNYTWGCSVAINDANAQVGYMNDAGLTSGTWGSIFNSGNRKDNSLSLSITPKYFIMRIFLSGLNLGGQKLIWKIL